VSKLHLLRQFLVHVFFDKFPIIRVYSYSLYNQRRGTSLSFNSTVHSGYMHGLGTDASSCLYPEHAYKRS